MHLSSSDISLEDFLPVKGNRAVLYAFLRNPWLKLTARRVVQRSPHGWSLPTEVVPQDAVPSPGAVRTASRADCRSLAMQTPSIVNSMMAHGRNSGKKLMAIRIIKHSLELIHLMTGKNPIQVFCVGGEP